MVTTLGSFRKLSVYHVYMSDSSGLVVCTLGYNCQKQCGGGCCFLWWNPKVEIVSTGTQQSVCVCVCENPLPIPPLFCVHPPPLMWVQKWNHSISCVCAH